MAQIQSLIQLSESCQQEIIYECFLSALQDQGTNFGYWLDKNGNKQIYWTGQNYGNHICSCYLTPNGCLNQDTLGSIFQSIEKF